MTVVRIPPTLRDEVGGARQVEADGATIREVLDDLVDRHPASASSPRERRPRAVRQRLPRRRGRPHARRARDVGQRRRHGDPAPRDGRRQLAALVARRRAQPARPRRQHAARRAAAHDAEARRDDLREARGPEPDRLDQGPGREVDDRGRRGHGRAGAGPRAARADVRQHGHLARARRVAQGLPAHVRDARERDRGAEAAAPPLRRRRSSSRRPRRARTAPCGSRSRWPSDPQWFVPFQYANAANPRAHYEGTGRRDRRRRSTASTCSSPASARAGR